MKKRKCKIAILDTGFSKYQEENLTIIKTFNFFLDNENVEDDHGHGTAILYLVNQIVSNAEYIIFKVLNENKESSIQILLRALEYLLEIDVTIICMCLSTPNKSKKLELFDVCEQLSNQGKILVSSKANRDEESYPASFSNVLGVEGILQEISEEYWYNENHEIQIVSDLTPVMVPDKTYQKGYMFGGNSKATGYMTGVLAKAWTENDQKDEKGRDIELLRSHLTKYRVRGEWTEEEKFGLKSYQHHEIKNEEKKSFIETYILNILQRYHKDINARTNIHGLLKPEEYYDICKEIISYFNIDISCFDIRYRDFDSIVALTCYVTKVQRYY